MKGQRPVNLNLLSMRFPVTAIVSIGHRLTGVLLFFFLPLLLWMLGSIVSGPSSYLSMMHCLGQPMMRAVSWLLLVCVGYHVLAGLRHLLMDAHLLPNAYRAGKITAWLVFVIAAWWAVYAGMWLW